MRPHDCNADMLGYERGPITEKKRRWEFQSRSLIHFTDLKCLLGKCELWLDSGGTCLLIPALGRHRQVDLSKLKACLVYKVSSRTVRTVTR